MVILDNKGMLNAGNNQYLQPDYLSPLPTTLDSKKSPLALLAQTCSQIGADSSKPLPSSDKKKEDDKRTPPSPPDIPPRRSPAFKPYESTSVKKEDVSGPEDKGTSASRPSSGPHGATQRPSSASSNGGSITAKEDGGRRSIECGATSSASTTPIIRSGLEVLAGHPKDVPLGTYRPGISPFLPPGYPGFESHPALRGAPAGLFAPSFLPSLSLASSYSGAAAALYSTAGLSSVPPSLLASPYLSYTRVKTGGGGEAVVPVCRDPFCTGCPYSVQNNHLLQSGGACPPSCTQCEQAKAALSSLPGLASVPPSSLVPASSLLPSSPSPLFPPVSSASPLLGGPPRPYVCNWIAGDAYCGKRFSSSEELLQHLRSHTSVTSDPSPLSLLSSPLHAHLLGSAAAAAHSPLQGFHRPTAAPTYPPPSLSPLPGARYHPYGKPSHSLSASVLSPSLPGLSHYPQLSAAAAAVGYPPGYPYASLYPRPPL